MTSQELEELLEDSPILYHMAERHSWPSIRKHGLRSTSALLDLYDVRGAKREALEREHRPSSTTISSPGLYDAVIRDQKAMSDSGLYRCLPSHITPSDWYALLNSKVFFWLSEERLHRMTTSREYHLREHEILEVNTRSLIDAHFSNIWLCPINSGCTKPMPHSRDDASFTRIQEYKYSHWKTRRRRGERVVELTVVYAVPDIQNHIERVIVKKGLETLSVLVQQ